jgi:hypothetical protein
MFWLANTYAADLDSIRWAAPVRAGAGRPEFIPPMMPILVAKPPQGSDCIREASLTVVNLKRSNVERVAGIEPARSAWEADKLPLHHTRAAASLPRNPAFGQSLSVDGSGSV